MNILILLYCILTALVFSFSVFIGIELLICIAIYLKSVIYEWWINRKQAKQEMIKEN